MSESRMSKSTSKTKAPVSILKRKPGDTSKAEYSRGRTNRVSVELSPREGNATADKSSSGNHLQAENSHLIAQNQRLLTELDSASQQLLQANSKLGELGGEATQGNSDTVQSSKVEILEEQVRLMQDKLSKSASAQWRLDSLTNEQLREKDEWKTRQKLLEGQLSQVKQECRRLRESHTPEEHRSSQFSSSLSTSHLAKSSSTQSLPAAYQPPLSVTLTTNLRPHPQSSNSTHKSFVPSSDVVPLANSTMLKLSPTSLSGSTSSLNSIKSTKSAHEFSRFTTKPGVTGYQYPGRSDLWSRHTGLTSTPRSKPFTATASMYQPHLPSSSHSFTSFSRSDKPLSYSLTSKTETGVRTSKRPGSASGYGNLTGRGRQTSLSRERGGGVGSTLNDATNGHRSAMSYLSVGDGRRGETSLVNGGSNGGSTSGESASPGASQTSGGGGGGGEGAKRQLGSPLSTSMELERAKAKIRLLEKEVILIEQQLSDKVMSSQSHVEELTRMRTDLAQERASINIFKQELQDGAAKEMEKVKRLHSKQCAELADHLEATRQEKRQIEKEMVKQRAELKARNAEVGSLSERVSSLHKQLDHERRSHDEAMQLLHSEVRGGSEHVNELEQALRACQEELEGHVTRVEETSRMQTSEVQELQKHVEMLSSELEHTQHQLLGKTELATRLQREVSEMRGQLQQEAAAWREREAELRHNLHHGDVLRQSLSQQIERSNQELKTLSGRLGEHQKTVMEFKKCQLELESLKRRSLELESEKGRLESSLSSATNDKQRLLVELGQEKTRSTKLAGQLKQAEKKLPSEVSKKEEAEAMVGELREEVGRLKREVEGCRERASAAEAQAREKESTVEDSLGHMQQELAKRAQQVLEMDALLRNHQADTTARRLQLERTLAQRQSELKTRTHEVEDYTLKLSEARKKISELEQQMGEGSMERERTDREQKRIIQEKDSQLSQMKERLKEVESMGVANSREMGHLKTEFGSVCVREKEWRESCDQLERKVEQLTSENDTLREHHLSQVQRLQDTHSALLSSREQQANSHRQQLQQLVDQERVRQEELSRCRAQVASLSAELAAERRVSEEARQQLARARNEAAQAQTKVANHQRSFHNTTASTFPNSSKAPPTSEGPSSLSLSSLPHHMVAGTTKNSTSIDQPRDSSIRTLTSSSMSGNNGIIDI